MESTLTPLPGCPKDGVHLSQLNRIGVNLNQMAYASPAYGSQS